jgi:hypothetical protein
MICINCIILLFVFKLNYFSIKKRTSQKKKYSCHYKLSNSMKSFFKKIAQLKNYCKNSIVCEDMHVLKDEIDCGRQMRTCPFVQIMQ